MGTIVALDFGIMGRLDPTLQLSLAEILLSFLTRDYKAAADVFFRIGLVPPHQDKAAFVQACRSIGEPILGLPLSEISFARLLGQVLSMAEDFEMTTIPDLLLLQKTMLVAEGVGRVLNPHLNIWQEAEPLAEAWMRRYLGPQAVVRRKASEIADVLNLLPSVVNRLAAPPAPVVVHERHRADWSYTILFALLAFILGLLIG